MTSITILGIQRLPCGGVALFVTDKTKVLLVIHHAEVMETVKRAAQDFVLESQEIAFIRPPRTASVFSQ